MKKVLFVLTFVLLAFAALAQIRTPVKWSFSSKAVTGTEAELLITANIEEGWHLYSQFIGEGGPVPTSFSYVPSKEYKLIGKTAESPKAVSSFDKTFGMQIAWHEKQVVFKQKIKILEKGLITVHGKLEFMVCNDHECLPPEELEFIIPVSLKAAEPVAALPVEKPTPGPALIPVPDSPVSGKNNQELVRPASPRKVPTVAASRLSRPEQQEEKSLLGIFLASFLSGLAAFFMPCIYPMVPLTVSFFTKRAGSKAKGIQSAALYGFSIILIYVLLGMLVTAIFGPGALNEFASSAEFNLTFFIILILFAFSFLGAFEITLPSSWVNKIDEKSNRGGAVGIFFMALTLAVVSFSCTGPIVGSLLGVISSGNYLSPVVGMFGFSLALALPFVLFAGFPGLLKDLPKSGGWLNTVKVSLGFLELALAFKFLSNVDLAYHWGLLNRDVFLVIWIVIFAVLGFYLLGKIRLDLDVELPFLSLPRLLFSMLVLGFAVYMIPGLWGAQLKPLSAWLPPSGSQQFSLFAGVGDNSAPNTTSGRKYSDILGRLTPHGLTAFYDFDEGLAYAKSVNKPVLLDFTGHSCANCRRMEESVWADPQVLSRLKNDYVLISLYVDDRTELPENEKYISASGKKIKTLGQKWSDLQTSRFKTNSQPYYVIADTRGQALIAPQAFNLDINNYITFLDSGKAAFIKNNGVN